MKRNLSILIALLASASCCDAQTVVNPALVRILEASEKPFPDFVKTFIAAPLPALPLPSSDTSSPTLVVSQLLWKRLASLDVVITKGNKTEALEALESMCALREGLLKRAAYTNLLFSSYVEETVSMSVLAALSDKLISVDEARQLMNQMKKAVALSEVVAVIEMVTPQSATVKKIKEAKAESPSLLDVSNRLSNELHELVDTRLSKLIERERLASLVFFVAFTSTTNDFAKALIEYESKGGELNKNPGDLASDVKRLLPEVIGKTDRASGLEIDAAMIAGLMDNVRKWKARH